MIKFKDSRIEKEWALLPVHNRRLKRVIEALEAFCDLEFGKPVMLTELYRDPAQNAAQGGIPTSPHMSWEAVDLRSWIYTDAELERVKSFLNQFTFRNGKQTCVVHAVPGGAVHCHVQVAKENK